jgi:hypothetical protein
LPQNFIDRAALEATSIDEAVRIVTQPDRADSGNFNFAQGARAVIVETTGADFEVIEVDRPAVHTNHLLAERLKRFEASPRLQSSHARYDRATQELRRLADPEPGDLRAILSSHADAPWCICRHDRRDLAETLATAIVSTATGTMDLSLGPPCQSTAQRFNL